MPLSPMPTPPSRADSASFAARADAWNAALVTLTNEINALGILSVFGNLDNTPIGQTTPRAGAFTELSASSGSSSTAGVVSNGASTSQGAYQFGAQNAAYNIRGGADYLGVETNTAAGTSIWQKVGGAIVTAATSAGLNVFGRVLGIRDGQTEYHQAGLESRSSTGDVHIALHAMGASAASIKHTRGVQGIQIVGQDGASLAPLSAGPITSMGASPYLSVIGQGGAFQAPNKFGVDHYGGYARIYSSGPNNSTNGGFEFHSTRADGSNDFIAATVDSLGTMAVNGELTVQNNLLVGVASGSTHTIAKTTGEVTGTTAICLFQNLGADNVVGVMNGTAIGSASGAGAALRIGLSGTTSRSINAAGTGNFSGADYAEYERNGGLSILKGSVIGFKSDGTLTNVYRDAVRFAIKSTNPCIVGGDTWGGEGQVGKRPDKPRFDPDPYTGSAAPTDTAVQPEPLPEDATQEQVDTHAAEVVTYDEAKAIYDAALYAYRMDMAQHTANVEVAQRLFDTATYPEYERVNAAFEERLEAARQLVDRIAYSGKVPCNVMGATPGGYIIAVAGEGGAIAGEFVSDPDFVQYKKAVGRVNRILSDGRAEVAVIIH